MKIIYITEQDIRNMFQSLVISDEIKEIINNIVLKYSYNYITFIYNIFNAYSNNYVSIFDEKIALNKNDIKSIISKLSVIKKDINVSNIYILDTYELIFGISPSNVNSELIKFNDYFYENIYSYLENMLGKILAYDYVDEVFESITQVTNLIEGNIVTNIEENNYTNDTITIYIDIHNNTLMFVVI